MNIVGYREAARFLGIPEGTLRAWVCRKTIPHIRLSARIVRFDMDELKAWVDQRRVPAK